MASKKKAADKAEGAPVAKSKAPPDIFALVEAQMKSQGMRNIQLVKAALGDMLSTGILCFDLLLGGGHKGGRTTQIYGQAHSGKSTTAYTALAELLNTTTIPTAMFDYEGTTDTAYITKIGVDLDKVGKRFMYMKVKDGPAMYKFIRNVAKGLPDKDSGPPQMVIFLDSVATMATEGEMENEEEDGRMARRATMHSTWWPRIKTLLSLKNISLIAINQIRANPSPYAPPVARPGGNAWEFYTDNLIKVKGGKKIRFEGEDFQPVTFSTEKNKNAVSGFEATVFLKLGQGFDPASDVIEFLKLTGLGRAQKVSGRNVFTVDERFTTLAKSAVELHGSVPIAAFEADLRGEASFRDAFRTAAQKLLATGEAFKLMQQHRIDTDKAKDKRATEKAAKIAAGEMEPDEEDTKGKKAKKGMKKVPAADEPTVSEDGEEGDNDEELPEFSFDNVVEEDEDEEDAA